jgi:hypothetical protein
MRREAVARIEQLLRPQQAANVIGSERRLRPAAGRCLRRLHFTH